MPTQELTLAAPSLGLSAAQRLHLEINGYVVIERLLEPQLVERIRGRLYDFERRVRAGEALPAHLYASETKRDYFRIDNLPHADPGFYAYATHPRITAIAREIIGFDVRLHQSDAHIRRSGSSTYRHYFHRDNSQDLGSYVHGMFHYPWIKALTVLDDVGPDDGGTCVIAGSHKLSSELNHEDVISAAEADPRMIHQMVAPAGSTVIFFESLLHTSGINRSNKDRPLIIAGYVPVTGGISPDYTVPPDFVANADPAHRELLSNRPGPAVPRFGPFPPRLVVPTLLERIKEESAEPWIDYKSIRIVSASFGDEGKGIDVMPLLRRIAAGERIIISYLTAGDPAPGVIKKTSITFVTQGGVHRSRLFVEGETIQLDRLLD
jgi:ectoine hydroxylase-related dioxygenase (phytanoyl-CoA dioxygenase family)